MSILASSVFVTYCFDLAAEQQHWQRWSVALDEAMAKQYQQPERARQFLAGRAFIRGLLQHLGQPSESIDISRQENGAPCLQVAGQRWSCSIAHTDDAALVALSAQPQALGVDLERLRLPRHWPRLQRKFADGMLADLGDDPDPAAFMQRWTLAEAVVKAEQGLLFEVLKRPPQAYMAHSRLLLQPPFIATLYHPECTADAINLIPLSAIG